MKKKILILGSTGLIGHQIHFLLSSNPEYEIANISYRNKLHEDTLLLDILDEALLNSAIQKIKPNYLINCVGTLIKESESDPELAIYTNAILPHRLKNICNTMSIKLIHMSTDCVFSGKKGNYNEKSFHDEVDIETGMQGRHIDTAHPDHFKPWLIRGKAKLTGVRIVERGFRFNACLANKRHDVLQNASFRQRKDKFIIGQQGVHSSARTKIEYLTGFQREDQDIHYRRGYGPDPMRRLASKPVLLLNPDLRLRAQYRRHKPRAYIPRAHSLGRGDIRDLRWSLPLPPDQLK